MKHWAHHLRDDLIRFELAVSGLIRNRHFWIGVFATLLFIGLIAMLVLWVWRTVPRTEDGFDLMYPYMHYRL
ncbi:hypothetical protein [Pontiella sp.]|uniref:hypothetical protein n=1 Tax=Pontiella sp. TaxID=2837462 RepID=UPI00356751C6